MTMRIIVETITQFVRQRNEDLRYVSEADAKTNVLETMVKLHCKYSQQTMNLQVSNTRLVAVVRP